MSRRIGYRGLLLAGVALLAGAPGAGAGPSDAGLRVEAVERLNAARARAGHPPWRLVDAVSRAAAAEAESLASQARGFPSRRPELLAELDFEIGDLSDRLEAEGYAAAAATATLVVGEPGMGRVLDRLLLPGDPFADGFLAAELPDLGLASVALEDGVAFHVFVVALSRGDELAERAAGLEDTAAVRRALLDETNRVRRRRRRTPLRADPCLDRVAQAYAERMLADGFFAHQSPDGETVEMRVRGARCPFAEVAENLAEGPYEPVDVVSSWLASPPHRRNLLSPELREAGFGLAWGEGPSGPRIVWVQVLAR